MFSRSLIFTFIFLFSILSLRGQEWESLDYNQDQAGLEYNPLKGFMTLWNPGNTFPHSFQGHSFGLNQIMSGMNSFNWSAVETAINKDIADGVFSTIQVIIDPANGTTKMPDFLIGQVDWLLKPGSSPSLCPDWNNETLMQALENFIAAFGKKYNNDSRIYSITLGLYGMWGEWHVGSDKTFEMTTENQDRLAKAYKDAFPDTNLQARYATSMSDPQIFGYSDGLVFGQSGYFLNQLKSAHADENWKQHIISGEIDPSLQGTLWKTWPNTVGEDVIEILKTVHYSNLISHYVLSTLSSSSTVEWNNAIRAQKMMGYTFYLNKYRLTASEGKTSVDVEIQNKGLAPFYGNWDVEIAVLNSSNHFQSLGKTKWNLISILPESLNHYKGFASTTPITDGTYKVMLRIINPLETLSAKAKPVRFANTTQDVDKTGWLTLGEMNIVGGACGTPPIRVSGIELSPATISLAAGEDLQLSPVISPSNASRKDISWSSDHPATVSVDSSGLLSAGTLYGQAVIYAVTRDGNFEAFVTVVVEPDWKVIPAKVEAEDFANQFGVQTQESNDVGGGLNVGWIDQGDWMEYAIQNTTGNVYFSAAFRISSPNNNVFLRVYLDNKLKKEIAVPNTGSWQNWETVVNNIKIEEGNHILKFVTNTGGFNINYFDLAIESEPGRASFKETNWQFPGDTILAYKYDVIHFQSDKRYFSLDTAQTIGVYGCSGLSGANILVYSDSAQHLENSQFTWDQNAETFQSNGQWIEYTARFNNNVPYQLLLRARNNVDANFKFSISTLEGEAVFSRDINLIDDFAFRATANDQTQWYISKFPIDLPWGDYVVRFDWYDQLCEPGIFGSFSLIESNLDVTAPNLVFVTTGNFLVGEYLEIMVNENAKVYLVPSGTPGILDSISNNTVSILDASANIIAYLATSGIPAGDYVFYAVDESDNVSPQSNNITLSYDTGTNLSNTDKDENISIFYDATNVSFTVKSKNPLQKIVVYDLLGRQKELKNLEGIEYIFYMESKNKGLYFFQVTDVCGNLKTMRVTL